MFAPSALAATAASPSIAKEGWSWGRARPCRSACSHCRRPRRSRTCASWPRCPSRRISRRTTRLRNPGIAAPRRLAGLERRICDALSELPQRVSTLAPGRPGRAALWRLADAGLATIAAFTPSDAMHVLGRQSGWNLEAAELGARLLAIEERNLRAASEPAPAAALCERIVEHVVRESARIVLATALAHDPAIEARADSWGPLGDALVGDVISGRPFSELLHGGFSLATPLVAIGAPVHAYYPEVARRLGARLEIPRARRGLQRGRRGGRRRLAGSRRARQPAAVRRVPRARPVRAAVISRRRNRRWIARANCRRSSPWRRRAAPARPTRTSRPRSSNSAPTWARAITSPRRGCDRRRPGGPTRATCGRGSESA